MRKTRALKYFVLFLPLIIIGTLVVKNNWIDTNKIKLPTGEFVSPEELRTKEVLTTLAALSNTILPMKVDSKTELQRIEGREGELVYHYVRINASPEQLDREKFVAKMRSQVIDTACHNPRLQVFLANGVATRYSFRGKDNHLIGEVVVTANECAHLEHLEVEASRSQPSRH